MTTNFNEFFKRFDKPIGEISPEDLTNLLFGAACFQTHQIQGNNDYTKPSSLQGLPACDHY